MVFSQGDFIGLEYCLDPLGVLEEREIKFGGCSVGKSCVAVFTSNRRGFLPGFVLHARSIYQVTQQYDLSAILYEHL